MKEDWNILIEAYLLNELGPNKKKAVEDLIANNSEFKACFDEESLLIAGIRHAVTRKPKDPALIRIVERQHSQYKIRRLWRRAVVAACLLLVVGLGIGWFANNMTSDISPPIVTLEDKNSNIGGTASEWEKVPVQIEIDNEIFQSGNMILLQRSSFDKEVYQFKAPHLRVWSENVTLLNIQDIEWKTILNDGKYQHILRLGDQVFIISETTELKTLMPEKE